MVDIGPHDTHPARETLVGCVRVEGGDLDAALRVAHAIVAECAGSRVEISPTEPNRVDIYTREPRGIAEWLSGVGEPPDPALDPRQPADLLAAQRRLRKAQHAVWAADRDAGRAIGERDRRVRVKRRVLRWGGLTVVLMLVGAVLAVATGEGMTYGLEYGWPGAVLGAWIVALGWCTAGIRHDGELVRINLGRQAECGNVLSSAEWDVQAAGGELTPMPQVRMLPGWIL